ncbi:MAG: DUF2293 domain-containing protein [Anaerolineae bacterium]|nr:DUF2293 domain-containing protein [Anaerolineae bacterium]MDK1119597.1 DUF2293 domain-containing protein [Anaerolineae bacterium]
MADTKEIRVFMSNRESHCEDCNINLERGDFIFLDKQKIYCLECADLSHLEYLPAGDAALTRRSKKYSELHATVYQWSSARKRSERQGVLVEYDALEKAQAECLDDNDLRAKRSELQREREVIRDQQFIGDFAKEIRNLYPRCPDGVPEIISRHACQKYSGRVGRSSAAKSFDEGTIQLAVVAHIRHVETNYDSMLMEGWDRQDARTRVRDIIDDVISSWR